MKNLKNNQRYITVKKAETIYPIGWRYEIHKAKSRQDSQGHELSSSLLLKYGVIVRFGRRVFVDTVAMERLMDEQRETFKSDEDEESDDDKPP